MSGQILLAARFGQWPFQTPVHRATMAQLGLVAAALNNANKPKDETTTKKNKDGKTVKGGRRTKARMSKTTLDAFRKLNEEARAKAQQEQPNSNGTDSEAAD